MNCGVFSRCQNECPGLFFRRHPPSSLIDVNRQARTRMLDIVRYAVSALYSPPWNSRWTMGGSKLYGRCGAVQPVRRLIIRIFRVTHAGRKLARICLLKQRDYNRDHLDQVTWKIGSLSQPLHALLSLVTSLISYWMCHECCQQ